jgi:hypothetical protein
MEAGHSVPVMQRQITFPLVAVGGPSLVQVSSFDLMSAAGGLGVRPFRYEGRHIRRLPESPSQTPSNG